MYVCRQQLATEKCRKDDDGGKFAFINSASYHLLAYKETAFFA